MVGDDDARYSQSRGLQRIGRVEHALEQQRQSCLLLQPGDVIPGRCMVQQAVEQGALAWRELHGCKWCHPLQVDCRHARSEEHTSELQSHLNLVCRLLLEKKKKKEAI